MKHLVLLSLLAFSFSSFAANVKVQKVTTLGVMKHKVIYQSRDLKRVKGTDLLKGKLVTQWGTQVFEIVMGYYKCDRLNRCSLTDYDRLARFEKCVVSKNNKKVSCSKPVNSSSYVSDTPDVVVNSGHFDHYDEWNQGSNSNYDYDDEFSVNVEGEFGNYGDLY